MHRHPLPRSRTLIQGQIESVTPAGTVNGWVRDAGRPTPCRVQMRLGDEVLAEAVADLFRPDLLHAGQGHGHFGFCARLRRPLPPGMCRVTMHLPDQDVSAPMPLSVPPLDTAGPARVEALLRQPAGWSAQDVCANTGCLDMDASLAALGTARFIDAVFRFALGRWPTEAEAKMNASSLAAGRVTPCGLLLECLSSRERADLPPVLPGPFSAEFPFVFPPGPNRSLR